MKPLNAKQKMFVSEYSRWRNGSKAARVAGYNPDTAAQKAWTLLHDPKYAHVQAAIEKALDDKEEQRKIQHRIKTDFLVQAIGFDVGSMKSSELQDWVGLDKLDPEDRKQIVSLQENVYENEGGQSGKSVSYKFVNKLKAVEILGKHNGYFADGATAGPDARYGEARENLHRMFARVKRRSAEPTPGDVDAGGGG